MRCGCFARGGHSPHGAFRPTILPTIPSETSEEDDDPDYLDYPGDEDEYEDEDEEGGLQCR